MTFYADPIRVVGGAGQTHFPELWMPPAAAHAEDDEFDGDALSGWSRTYTPAASAVDPTAAFATGTPRDDIKDSWFRIQPPADDTNYQISKQFSGGGELPDGTYFARFSFDYRLSGGGEQTISMFLAASDPPTIDPFVGGRLTRNSAGNLLYMGEEHDGTTYTSYASGDLDGEGLRVAYLAIVRKKPNYYTFWGDGVNWGYMGPAGDSLQPGGTLSWIVIGVKNTSSNAPGCPILKVDFFRYLSDTVLP